MDYVDNKKVTSIPSRTESHDKSIYYEAEGPWDTATELMTK